MKSLAYFDGAYEGFGNALSQPAEKASPTTASYAFALHCKYLKTGGDLLRKFDVASMICNLFSICSLAHNPDSK
jgi:hypothetical protein